MIRIEAKPSVFNSLRGESWDTACTGGNAASYHPDGYVEGLYCVELNGVRLRAGEMHDAIPQDGDTLTFYPDLQFGLETLIGYPLTAVLVAGLSYGLNVLLAPNTNSLDDEGAVASTANLRTRGNPIPLVYGERRVGAYILSQYTTQDNKGDTRIHTLYTPTAGPIEGIGSRTTDFDNVAVDDASIATNIEVGGNGISNFAGCTVSFRKGELDQEPIPGFQLVHDVQEINVLLDQPYDSDNEPQPGPGEWYQHQTTGDIDWAVLQFSLPRGLHKNNDGDIDPYKLYVEIRYRETDVGGGTPGAWVYVVYDQDTETWTTSTTDTDSRPVRFTAKRTAPITLAFTLTLPARTAYDIEVRRRNRNDDNDADTSEDSIHKPTKKSNEVYLASIDEVVDYGLSYPGLTLFAIHDMDANLVSGRMPDATFHLKGRLVPVWDGVDTEAPVYQRKYSNTPAWVALDLLTDARNGIGGYVEESDPDLEDMLEWADYTDELVDDGRGGTEKRAVFNGVISQEEKAWESLRNIGSGSMCSPYIAGRRIRFSLDKPRTRVDVFGMGNILEDSWSMEYLNYKDSPNVVNIRYRNEDANFQEDLATWELDEVLTNTEQVRQTTIDMPGVTSPGQALRLAKRLALHGRRLRKAAEFGVGLENLRHTPGQVVGMTHDVTTWSSSGRCAAGATSTTIKLDADVTLAAATTYEVLVRSSVDGTEQVRTVSSAAGTYSAGEAITVSAAWDSTPVRHDVWCLGVENLAVRDWVVDSIDRKADLSATLRVATYDSTIYDEADDIDNLVEDPASNPVPLDTRIPPDATNLEATIRLRAFLKAYIVLTWQTDADPEAQHYTIMWKKQSDRVWSRLPGTYRDSADVEIPATSVIINIAVVAVSIGGERRAADASPSVTINLTTGQITYRTLGGTPTALTVTQPRDVMRVVISEPSEDADGADASRLTDTYRARRGSWWHTAVGLGEAGSAEMEFGAWAPAGAHVLVKAVDYEGFESVMAAGSWTDYGVSGGRTLVLSRSELEQAWPGNSTAMGALSDGRLAVTAGQIGGVYQTPVLDLGSEQTVDVYITCTPAPMSRRLSSAAAKMPIAGAVTGGPFTEGETVTGGTSGATGKLIKGVSDGEQYLYIDPASGTFSAGETVTGGTSSASCVVSAAAATLTFADSLWETWTTCGPADVDHTNVSLVELGYGNTTLCSTVVSPVGAVERIRTRYLQVTVTASTDDATNYQPVLDDLRVVAVG